MVIDGYAPPNGPVCPDCGSVLKTHAHTRTMGYGGTSKYTENSWKCPNNCIITPRTICIECGSPMIVKEYNVPSKCSECGATEPSDHITPKPKMEYKIKCKYCGDIQIINKKDFEEILENGCDDECWECLKRGYEPVISEEPPIDLTKHFDSLDIEPRGV